MPFGPTNVSSIPNEVQQWIVQNPQLAEQLGKALGGNRPFGAPAVGPTFNQPNYQNDIYGRNANVSNPMNFGQSQQQASVLPGKVINGPQDIKMNEIPMDGTVALFPTSDYSAIYAKCWNSNGGIDTMEFNPKKSPEEKTEKTSEYNEVLARLEKIESMLASLPVLTQNVPGVGETINYETTISSTGKKPKKGVVIDA